MLLMLSGLLSAVPVPVPVPVPGVSALIVETGTGLTNADAYCSLAFANAYLAARGYVSWAARSDGERDQAIRRATDYMLGRYRYRWAGRRVTDTQALDWPRDYVPRRDFTTVSTSAYYARDTVPLEVQQACAELAYRAASAELNEDLQRAKRREKIGPIEFEYEPGSPQFRRYPSAEAKLAPFLFSQSSIVELVRA